MNASTKKSTLILFAIVVAMACSSSYSFAEDDEDDKLSNLTQHSSTITLGVGSWNGDREQLGKYDNIRDDEDILLLDVDYTSLDQQTGSWLTLKLRDFGIDTREAELNFDRQGDWGIGFEYDEITKTDPYTVSTALAGFGGPTQTITAIAPGTGSDEDLRTERKTLGLDFHKYLAPGLNLIADFKTQEKDGDRHWGYRRAGGGNPVLFLVEPIDSTTNQLEAKLDYAGKSLQLNGGYYGSWYENNEQFVTAINPDIGSIDYLSSPLDNEAHQFFLNGGYSFTPSTRGTFRLSYTHATMDESLPTAGIAGVAAAGSPRSIDGEVNTTNVYLALSSRPLKDLSLVANLKYHDVDDETPASLIVPAEPVHVKANDYRTLSGKLEGTYRFAGGFNLIAGVDYRDLERDRPLNLGDEQGVPFSDDTEETTYKLQLRKTMSENISGSLAFSHSERDSSNYDPADEPVANIPVSNTINPAHFADRDRDKWRASIDWTVSNNLGLQFNYEHSDDDYGPSSNPNGLLDGSAELFSVDLNYIINKDWQLSSWASWDELKAKQQVTDYGQTGNPPVGSIGWVRTSNLKDTGKSFGLGIDGQINPKIKVGANLDWTRTNSDYEDDDPRIALPDIPLPDIESTATIVKLFAEYKLNKRSDLRFDFGYERWKSDDWTWNFSDGVPFSYDNDGTTIYYDGDESATFVGISYRYKFN